MRRLCKEHTTTNARSSVKSEWKTRVIAVIFNKLNPTATAMTEMLTEVQLKRLSEHKYSAQSSTILDPMMQIYWRWLVEKCPLWLAPNTITFTGLVMNIVTTLLLVYYCPQAKGEVSKLAGRVCLVGTLLVNLCSNSVSLSHYRGTFTCYADFFHFTLTFVICTHLVALP